MGYSRKEEHNIFTYAKKELGQDAFIALLCALYNSENQYEKDLSEKFISFLFEDGQCPIYNQIEILTQYSNIDVLIKFYNNNEPIKYLIIEDKTDSEEHGGQIEKYINKIRKVNKNNDSCISVVYYKTGHLLKSNSELSDTNDKKKPEEKKTRWRFQSKVSEFNRLKDIKNKKCQNLNSFKILDLESIYHFFYVNQKYIYDSNNDILICYFENLKRQYNAYIADELPADNPTAPIWAKVFDEFVQDFKKNKEGSSLRFDVNKYSGQYWEVRISSYKGVDEKEEPQASKYPVMLYNSRVQNRIRFVNKENTDDEVQEKFIERQRLNKKEKQNESIFSYKLDTQNADLTVAFIKNLLNVICKNYENIVNNPNNGQKFYIDENEICKLLKLTNHNHV